MDYKKNMQVYKAAEEGDLDKLEVQVRYKPKAEVKVLVEPTIDGATPLVIASNNGHIDVVKFLIESCDAAVESTGNVIIDGKMAKGVSPLWCAAVTGHLDIVKYLVKNSANVNSTTSTNSTPSRSACFDGYMDIVKYLVENNADIEIANRPGHTCLIVACYKGHTDVVRYLLSMGADVNRKDEQGCTALHWCAKSESGNIELGEILFENGMKIEDIELTNKYGQSCLMICSLKGHMDFARYLLNKGADVNRKDIQGHQGIMELLLQHEARMEEDNEGITPLFVAANTGYVHLVEYLIKRDSAIEKECIEALELLGAKLYEKKDVAGVLKYWEQALLRRSNTQEPITKPEVWSWVITNYGTEELETLEELNELKSDPVKMATQVLLVRERILGPTHLSTICALDELGCIYARNQKDFRRCMALWMYALEMQMNKREPLSQATQRRLHRFAHLYSMNMSRNFMRSIKYTDIYEVFSKAVVELERGREILAEKTEPSMEDKDSFSRIMKVLMHLMSVICQICDLFTPPLQQDSEFKTQVKLLIKMDPRTSQDETLLHLAVQESTMHVVDDTASTFSCMRCVKLLTSLGIPRNSVDENGRTAYDLAFGDYSVDYELLVKLKYS